MIKKAEGNFTLFFVKDWLDALIPYGEKEDV